ncbi:DUF4377 domain-containing protein [Mariniflexile ostreae]|uniref:DUF4377 domain-containing protein n=1 Tax=Mariniflexile ostreae TaxID=1520892 RepID=A0ABV5FE76_9FLAO
MIILYKTLSALCLLVILNTSCSSSKTSPSNTTTFWINSMKTDCDIGAGHSQCLQIFKGSNLDDAQWSLFHSTIEGFVFEPGYLQKVKVSETFLDPKNIPADASSITYKLIQVLHKKQDPRMALHDIWAATKINGEKITDKTNTPTLEINISKMKIFGSDGCNQYSANIDVLTSSTIGFEPIISTRKMCENMIIPGKYSKALQQTVRFKRENLSLTFYDAENHETISFKKVD